MTDSIYDEVVSEVAADLGLQEILLRFDFARFLSKPQTWRVELPPETAAACYAVYRLTKQRGAFRMASKTIELRTNRLVDLRRALETTTDSLVYVTVAMMAHDCAACDEDLPEIEGVIKMARDILDAGKGTYERRSG